jgi:hypothetical protein
MFRQHSLKHEIPLWQWNWISSSSPNSTGCTGLENGISWWIFSKSSVAIVNPLRKLAGYVGAPGPSYRIITQKPLTRARWPMAARHPRFPASVSAGIE